MDQPKVDRILRVMKMLTGNNTYTISDIASRIDTSDRTVYRYIDTFREAGFIVKKEGEIYRLDKNSPHFKDINNLLHFSDEEAYILKSAIESIDETNVIKQNLKKKLYTLYDYKIMAESVVHGKTAIHVTAIVQAITEKKQVILKNYSSANSKDIRDRIIEPFAFTTNYIQIWAYDTESNTCKLFKTTRIAHVELLETTWQHESQHEQGFIDVFRMSSSERTMVRLKLSLRAASLLVEEYPLAEKQLHKLSDTIWVLETEVASLDGVGRFVMGLIDEIQILEPIGLKEYIYEKFAKQNLNTTNKN